jgi:hypothetical protein
MFLHFDFHYICNANPHPFHYLYFWPSSFYQGSLQENLGYCLATDLNKYPW